MSSIVAYLGLRASAYRLPITMPRIISRDRSMHPCSKDIMQRYGIDTEHVVRHYDVTGKRCPMPWVDDPAQWAAFKDMLTPKNTTTDEEDEDDMVRYNTIDDVPDWAQDTVRMLMDAGALQGDEHGCIDPSARLRLHISMPMLLALRHSGCQYARAPQCHAVSPSRTDCIAPCSSTK